MKLFYTDADLERNEGKRKAIKDTLSELRDTIPWTRFLPILQKTFRGKSPKAPGGRPAFPLELMMKVLVLQRVYNLSDAQMEYQILDRNSFKDFLGLGVDSRVPDEKTIWSYRNELAKKKADVQLFAAFDAFLMEKGGYVKEGVIVDASFIEVPRSKPTKEENQSHEQKQQKQEGEAPASEQEPSASPRERQLDYDAKWTKKNSKSYFGYKDHVKVDAGSKFITKYVVTPANIHDSPVLHQLLEPARDKGQAVYADKGYTSWDNDFAIRGLGMKSRIMKKAVRNAPLTEKDKEWNQSISKIRARVEHVFGYIEIAMNRMYLRAKGLMRITFTTGLMNLVYNLLRYTTLQRARSA
jgi:IS5 family transposase